jgi:hypothetical protein
MKPDTHTVQQLFERDVRYVVPLYQRPYVWNEGHQWEPLWEDILALLQHQEGSASSLWSHFLGALVLEQEQMAPGQIPHFTVIDGQQRLTTLQLLVAAAAAEMGVVGADNDAALLRELVENNPRRTTGTQQLKVWPTNANRTAFIAVMSPGGPPPDHVDDPDNRIDEAYEYFRKRAAEYLTGADEDDSALQPDSAGAEPTAGRAERLRITISHLLKVVSITLEADDNAQVIFETLNARGTPLLSLDLVKNAVFHLATRQQRDADTLYEQVWRPQLDDDYWRQERRQGRLNRPIGELFLMHWLTMRVEDTTPATELFATFRQYVLQPAGDAEALIRELVSDAAVVRTFDSQPPGTPEAAFFARLTALDASTVMPIVLLLFRSAEVTQDRRRRCLRMLESWLTRRALMRLTAKNYNRLIPRLVARLKADLAHCDEILHAALSGGEGAISRWPDDQELIEFLTSRDLYGMVSRPRLAMALAAVEDSLRTTKTEASGALVSEIAGSLSIEHLIPQDWEAHWPLTDPDGKPIDREQAERATAERNARLHRLGNLTIATSPLNASMSNSPWTAKREALNEHTRLLLNARIARRDRWDEQAVDEHGQWLTERLIAVWPGPDPRSWA